LRVRIRSFLFALSIIVACKEEPPPPFAGAEDSENDTTCGAASETIDVADEVAPEVECRGGEIELLCIGNWAALCDPNGRLLAQENCREQDLTCAARICEDDDCELCLECKPHGVVCGEDGERRRCKEDGSGYEDDEPCDTSAGLQCDELSGECLDLCAEAAEGRSYIGCEYWAVYTTNQELDFEGTDSDGLCRPFSFAIVVANGEGIDAHVEVEAPGGAVFSATVAPRKSEIIELPCSPELKGIDDVNRLSTLLDDAAHHITSDVPVTIYQFNPLEFQAESAEGEEIFSYTNGGSLLLPVTSMTGNYIVMSAPTRKHVLMQDDESESSAAPGFMTIVGVSDEPAEVTITSSAHTLPSADDDILPALAPGDTFTFKLEKGQVAQLLSATPDDCEGDALDFVRSIDWRYCEVPREFDLTGTRIAADRPVMVVSGHDCPFVPFNRWACDHVEESMLPLETWGPDILVAQTNSVSCKHEGELPDIVRVLASEDETRVSFAPDVHETVFLDRGEFLDVEIFADVRVLADAPIAVAQFTVGQDFVAIGSSGVNGKGDPAMTLGVPLAQWRDRYSILSPETFTDNFVNVIAQPNQAVLVDGRLVTGYRDLGDGDYVTARVALKGGQHTLESSSTFGITVYGYAPYTTYMVPGGLDLRMINTPD
jgi:hypothetical protein